MEKIGIFAAIYVCSFIYYLVTKHKFALVGTIVIACIGAAVALYSGEYAHTALFLFVGALCNDHYRRKYVIDYSKYFTNK